MQSLTRVHARSVSIPERVLEALKLSRLSLFPASLLVVSIPERVLEALKLHDAIASVNSLGGFNP